MSWNPAPTRNLSIAACCMAIALGCGDGDSAAASDTSESFDATDTDSGADAETEGGDTSDPGTQSQRGVRICELNELFVSGETLSLRVWNDVGLHDCPDAWLAAIDRDVYAVGGPRWRSIDEATPIDGVPDLGTPQEVPAGLGYEMVEAAVVELFPIAALEGQLGITIETLDDIPLEVRRMILSNTLLSTGYAVTEVQREFQTEFVYHAGKPVFVLDDGACQYAMKYYTSIVDPELVDEDAIATLGERFTQLPAGYSFSVQSFESDLVIREDSGVQYVMTDEFGNSYDRFGCE